MAKVQEYVTPSGETISIRQQDNGIWEVDCWDENGDNRWHLHFLIEDEARKEYERWRK